MATYRDRDSERRRERARIVDPVLRGIWILLGLLAMVGGTLVLSPAGRGGGMLGLFFVALGGYCLALGTVGFQGVKNGRSYRAFVQTEGTGTS
jgi:hypothetical protein